MISGSSLMDPDVLFSVPVILMVLRSCCTDVEELNHSCPCVSMYSVLSLHIQTTSATVCCYLNTQLIASFDNLMLIQLDLHNQY